MNPDMRRKTKGRMLGSVQNLINRYWDEMQINLFYFNDYLSEEQRGILRLYYIECKSVDEISRICNLSSGRVYAILTSKRDSVYSKLSKHITFKKEELLPASYEEMINYMELCNQEQLMCGIRKLTKRQTQILYNYVRNNNGST
jgi:predicted DNA-binding protein YlxM (UPF0122 family)